jgi:hypothetical protein
VDARCHYATTALATPTAVSVGMNSVANLARTTLAIGMIFANTTRTENNDILINKVLDIAVSSDCMCARAIVYMIGHISIGVLAKSYKSGCTVITDVAKGVNGTVTQAGHETGQIGRRAVRVSVDFGVTVHDF